MRDIYRDKWLASFPNRLSNLLEIRKITRKELAEDIGVTEAAISRYINANRVPKVTTLMAICEALDVDSIYFMRL